MDKMREEFEAWASGYNVYRSDIGDHYVDGYVDVMWSAWKASRSALCVELPESCYGDIREACIVSALDNAGVSYK